MSRSLTTKVIRSVKPYKWIKPTYYLQYCKPFTTTFNSNYDKKMEQLVHDNIDHTKEHRQHILSNKHPDLCAIKHPNFAFSPHPIWSNEQLNNITKTHKKPSKFADYCAYSTVWMCRNVWDITTGYKFGRQLQLFEFSYRMWLLRLIFLETIAGVPGIVFGTERLLKSLRTLQRDRGWIITLIEDAQNERMHLLTVRDLYKPGIMLKSSIIIAQIIFKHFLSIAYKISPRYCFSFVGYLEEEAVHTYTLLIKDIENGLFPEFNERASDFAKLYWKLDDNATWLDVFKNIRADEAHHRNVNQTFAELSTNDPTASSPFVDNNNEEDKKEKRYNSYHDCYE